MIHQTAIIDPDARLGKDVEVGPYAVVGPKVTIGDGCSIGSHVLIASHVRMGKGNRIFPYAAIGGPPQDIKFKGEETWVEIGDGTTIREYVTINRGTSHGGGVTRLGDGSFLLAYCHIGHDCQVGKRVIMSNGATLGGHVEVGDGAVLGGLAGVHQFVRIGSLAMVGAMSGVPQDVPPYVTAVVARPAKGQSLYGLNLIGLKRNNVPEASIASLKNAYRILFRSGLLLADAIRRVESEVEPLPEVLHLLEFIKGSKRGVLR
jgi:UDP-N-acetylglucosamine acyltransferase